MMYRIVAVLVLAAIAIGCYLIFGEGTGSVGSATQPAQQSAPSGGVGDPSLKGFKIP